MEPTKEYFEDLSDIYDVMYNKMGIQSQKLSVFLGGDQTAENKDPTLTRGIVKICASYLSEMWITNKLLINEENTLPLEDR
jgi:hypothetical protein